MDLSKLASHVKASEIDEINLVTVEGGSYVMHVLINGASQPVVDAKGKTLHIASIEEARKNLTGVPPVPLFLITQTVYDEMVGQPDEISKPAREKLEWHSSL